MIKLLKLLSGLAMFWVSRRRARKAQAEPRSGGTDRSRDPLSAKQKERIVAGYLRHVEQPWKASTSGSGVEISLLDNMWAHLDKVWSPPRAKVWLQSRAGMTLCSILRNPGSGGRGFGFNKNKDMLMVGWSSDQKVEIEVLRGGDKTVVSLGLSPAQARQFGDEIAESLVGEKIVIDHENFGLISMADERVTLLLPDLWRVTGERGLDEVNVCLGRGAALTIARGLCSTYGADWCRCRVNGRPGAIRVLLRPDVDGQCAIEVIRRLGPFSPLPTNMTARTSITLWPMQARHLGEAISRLAS